MYLYRCSAKTRRAVGFGPGAVALALFCVHALEASEPMRTWTDSTGEYSVRAEFAGVQTGKVTLQQADGTEVSIPLEKLNAADQEYVRQRLAAAAENPFKTVAPNRLLPVGESPRAAGTGSSPRETLPDWSTAKKIDVIGGGDWRLSEPAAPAAGGSVKPIALPSKTSFFENAAAMAIAGTGRYAAVGYTCKPPARDAKVTTTVVVCDLAEGLLLGSGAVEGELLVPIAVHDSRAEVLMRRNESGLGNQDCLETWTIDAAGVSRGMKWVPYADEKDRDRNVTWAAYLDENRLATCSAGGRLAIWDVETTRPICYLDVKGRPALSPDRKHLAFLVEGQVGVLDVEGQKVVALQAAPVSGGVLAFTPSGKRFVTLSGAELYVWDFATGQLQRECRLEGVHAGDELLCPSEEHLLAGSGRLYDFVNQVNVWDYRGYQKAGIAGGVCWLAVVAGERQPSALVPARLPHEGVADKLETAMADPDFFVFKPGTTVKIDVGKIADSAARTKVQDALVKKLEARGCKAGANGTITLAAGVEEAAKKAELRYRSFGSFGYDKYKMTKFISRLEFIYDGKTAWKSLGNNLPGFIVHLGKDQTMKQYIKEREKPNYEYFDRIELPKLLTKPTGAPTLGSSQVTVSGIQ
ncbi:MAG: hypothetical protein GXY25_13160 [Pirellulaceae bacterium]|nr:SHD1 domain-containing protein [Planctomycetota bacterium]NLZ01473.1 hypothetical protein [Pirellulaceae bacterium]